MNQYYSEYYHTVKGAIKYYMSVAAELRIDSWDFRDICNERATTISDVEKIWREYRDAKLDHYEELKKRRKEMEAEREREKIELQKIIRNRKERFKRA